MRGNPTPGFNRRFSVRFLAIQNSNEKQRIGLHGKATAIEPAATATIGFQPAVIWRENRCCTASRWNETLLLA